jgi:predicted RNase H-like HicB family nuclease
MISRYVAQALGRARYEPIAHGRWSATVRGLRGVIAVGASIEKCRQSLAEAVEDWILVRVSRDLPVPKLGGVVIRVRRAS